MRHTLITTILLALVSGCDTSSRTATIRLALQAPAGADTTASSIHDSDGRLMLEKAGVFIEVRILLGDEQEEVFRAVYPETLQDLAQGETTLQADVPAGVALYINITAFRFINGQVRSYESPAAIPLTLSESQVHDATIQLQESETGIVTVQPDPGGPLDLMLTDDTLDVVFYIFTLEDTEAKLQGLPLNRELTLWRQTDDTWSKLLTFNLTKDNPTADLTPDLDN